MYFMVNVQNEDISLGCKDFIFGWGGGGCLISLIFYRGKQQMLDPSLRKKKNESIFPPPGTDVSIGKKGLFWPKSS